MITKSQVAPDVVALSAWMPGPEGMALPVHAYCVLGREPVLVDTGLSPLGAQFREALWGLVEPADLRWIVVTHDDRDHTGSLRAILEQAPHATVVTNFVSMVKIGEDWPLPMDRLRLVNSGDRVEVGDDALDAFRPPTYDSPGTLAFHALRRGVCFTSDCLGAFVPATTDLGASAEDLPEDDYTAGVAVFASAISPWMHDLRTERWHAALADLRGREVATLLSTHGLPVRERLGPLLGAVADLPTGPAFVPPAQEFVESVLAMSR